MLHRIRYTTAPLTPFNDFLADLEVLGMRPVASGGELFSVVQARSNLRWWLIPSDHGHACAWAGYEMLQPVSRIARLGKWSLQALENLGLLSWFWGKKIRLSGTPGFLSKFGEKPLCCAYFTGTDGPHRKTTAQIMTRRGKIIGYAKITRNPMVMPYLENEARMLEYVAGLELASASVPKLLEHKQEECFAQLVTDSLRVPEHVVARRLGPAHRAFLAELAVKTERAGGAETLSKLTERLVEIFPFLSDEWSSRLNAGVEQLNRRLGTLRVGLAHGDFTPWNTFLVGQKLYVFDWEYAQPNYPLGYDAVHFTLAASPVSVWPNLLKSIEEDIATEWYAGDRAAAAYAILFSLLLHAAFYLDRVIAVGQSEKDWAEAGVWATAIDSVLIRIGV